MKMQEVNNRGRFPGNGEMPDMENFSSNGEMSDLENFPGNGEMPDIENFSSNIKMPSMETTSTVTTYIPVGVTVHTTTDVATTFSRLANGDLIKMLVEADESGNDIIEEIWMLSISNDME